MEICKTCSLYNEKGIEGCTAPGLGPCCNSKKMENDIHGCGCTLSAKTACMSCNCPLKKWTAVISQEEEGSIHQKFEDGK